MSNSIVIRLPPIELEVLGAKVQVNLPAALQSRTITLSEGHAQTFRLFLELLGALGTRAKLDQP